MPSKIYDWDTVPNISLLDKGVLRWDEWYIEIENAKENTKTNSRTHRP